MKVLMLNYEYPPLGGGGAAVCRDISETLVKSGDEVSVVTMSFKGLADRENSNGVDIHRVTSWRSKAKVCHPWEQMTYCMSAYQYVCHRMNMKEYDAVHCHFIIPTGLLALWLKRKYNLNYMVTAQGSDVLGHNNARFKNLYKIVKPIWISILKNASVITAPSQYLVNKIRESYPEVECRIIPNGLHVQHYMASERKKSIVTMSRLQESKGIQDLVEVCSRVDMGEWKVNILGEGPFKDELKKMIHKYGLQEKVFLRGYVSDEEHIKYLSEASIFFTGSWFEAMPISVLEAMASKNQIIASDIDAHNEILPENCIYHSLDDLKVKLRKCMDKMDHVCEYDMQKYDWTEIVKQYRNIYEQLI